MHVLYIPDCTQLGDEALQGLWDFMLPSLKVIRIKGKGGKKPFDLSMCLIG